MQSGAVIEGFDVVEDGGACLSEGGEATMIDELVFEAAPEGFDEGVIVTVALATHGRAQTMLRQDLTVSGAGELAPTIGVKDEPGSGAALAYRHTQGRDGQWSIQARTHSPTDNPTAKDIQDRDQIQPTLPSQHARRVTDPNLIATPYAQIWQTIRSNRSTMATIGRRQPILGTAPGKEPLRVHEPGDAVTLPWTTQA